MSLYKKFKTDPVLEQEGVVYDYGDFRLRIRRAGGSNKRYALALEKALAPWRKPGRDIDKEDVSVRAALFTQLFCDACYVEHSWETLVDGVYQRGIQVEDGSIVPGTIANVVSVLSDLPDLSRSLQAESADVDHYLASVTKATVENLA